MYFGEVAERSIAADCKSAGLVPTEVRILPCPPPFAPLRGATAGQPVVAVAGYGQASKGLTAVELEGSAKRVKRSGYGV